MKKMTVYKYNLNLGETSVNLPHQHKILTAKFRGEQIVLWVLVKDITEIEQHKTLDVKFLSIEAGVTIETELGLDNLEYVSTAQCMMQNSLSRVAVYHVFRIN